MLDVKRLALLREVALHGSLKGAARARGLSSSAISQQLTKLEHDTGVVLLEPAGRGVQLTPIALHLVERTERIIAELEASEAVLVAGRDRMHEVVRIVGFNTFAIDKLPKLIRTLRETHPRLAIEFVQLDPEEAMDELIARRADLILADEYPAYPLRPGRGLIRTDVTTEPISAYFPAGHCETVHHTHDLDCLAELAWVMEPSGTEANMWGHNTCRMLGFEPTVPFESPNLQVLRRLVEDGIAAAFLPHEVAAEASVPLTPISLFPSDLHRTVHTVIRRGTQHRPGIIACLEAIEQLYREPVVGGTGQPA